MSSTANTYRWYRSGGPSVPVEIQFDNVGHTNLLKGEVLVVEIKSSIEEVTNAMQRKSFFIAREMELMLVIRCSSERVVLEKTANDLEILNLGEAGSAVLLNPEPKKVSYMHDIDAGGRILDFEFIFDIKFFHQTYEEACAELVKLKMENAK
jgi:hypothetical protein